MNKVILSSEQESVMLHLAHGGNVLVTGSAGTGKSTLLAAIRERFDRKLPVTASTGIAAVNVGGMTIHSWCGLGLAEEAAELLAAEVLKRGGKVLKRVISANRLAIDEVSMIHGDLLDKLDAVLRIVRRSDEPFGGLQLIFFGDFLQLPPVSRGVDQKFAFQSEAWKAAKIKTFMLTKVFRQDDQEFVDALNEIRLGRVPDRVRTLLESRWRVTDGTPEIHPVVMFTHNADVDGENMTRLRALNGDERRFESRDKGENGPLKALQKHCLAPEILRLKVGAQVMLLWNVAPDAGLANGTLGIVAGFDGDAPKVRFSNGMTETMERKQWTIKNGEEVMASREQYPLRLAWCITVHKSQGMTLDKIRVHLDKVFEPGQSYVALSRVKSLGGLFIESSKIGSIRAHPEALAFYEGL